MTPTHLPGLSGPDRLVASNQVTKLCFLNHVSIVENLKGILHQSKDVGLSLCLQRHLIFVCLLALLCVYFCCCFALVLVLSLLHIQTASSETEYPNRLTQNVDY